MAHVIDSVIHKCPECNGVVIPVGSNPPKEPYQPYMVKCYGSGSDDGCGFQDVYGVYVQLNHKE